MAGETCPTAPQRAQWRNGVFHAVAAKERLTNGERMTPLDLQVAMLLVDCYVNREDGNAWPSQNRLARDLGVTRPAVCRSLQRLTIAGFITSERRGQHDSSVIRLNLGRMRADPRLEDPDVTDGTHLTRQPGPRGSAYGALLAKSGVIRRKRQMCSVGNPDVLHGAHDSIGRTLSEGTLSDLSRPRVARAPHLELRTPEVQQALAVWNDFCERIGQAKIHRLDDQNTIRMHELLTEYGFGAWCAIVDQFAARVERAREEQDDPRPAYLGIALAEADELLDRARADGSYPPAGNDEVPL